MSVSHPTPDGLILRNSFALGHVTFPKSLGGLSADSAAGSVPERVSCEGTRLHVLAPRAAASLSRSLDLSTRMQEHADGGARETGSGRRREYRTVPLKETATANGSARPSSL